MNNGIQVIYPRTKYLTLNQTMQEFLEKTTWKKFNKEVEGVIVKIEL